MKSLLGWHGFHDILVNLVSELDTTVSPIPVLLTYHFVRRRAHAPGPIIW